MEARWNGENSNIIMTGETFFVNICIWVWGGRGVSRDFD